MKIDSAFIAVAPTTSYDGHCIWVKVGREMFPLVYLRKPKWVSNEDFKKAMLALEVELPANFELHIKPDMKPIIVPGSKVAKK